MRYNHALPIVSAVVSSAQTPDRYADSTTVDLSWHRPAASEINDLESAINGTGTYGFIFNSSSLPDRVPYGTYNWCNMPHARSQEYPIVNSSFELQYVEVIHRHHKRTPYASNTFPRENYPWFCDDEGLFYYGAPLPSGSANRSAAGYWSVYTSDSNPLAPAGFNGTCQFPQITRGGLDDSHQHGKDLFDVYGDLLGFIPSKYDPELVSFRVTNNVITSKVAGMVIAGMYPDNAGADVKLSIQPDSVDSLEPAYICTTAKSLFSFFASGSTNGTWAHHLQASASLYSALDRVSGVSPGTSAWHVSWDHYFDNLSARLCHSKPLPCNTEDGHQCVGMAQAEEVFRLGEWEYSYTYRDNPNSLRASVASYGIYIAELAQNIRHAIDPTQPSSVSANDTVKYRHNVAHDGSISRLLSILQVDKMFWPGMGSEVIFELYKQKTTSEYFVRVLWGGQILKSSHPAFGEMNMVPPQTLLAYFDGLVGVGADKIPGLCGE
ncbi:hypothetical protein AAFC00_004460 [Neodothiora populina]|uniref:Phosphoglycerate mutase-like protein n=1 Tax=Neodothiora populina TaxID=2781224 RepID=A0ABR3P237_9PEZI